MTSSKTNDTFQSFSSLHHFVLISLSNLNNFNIVLSESVNLIKLNQSHQSDSEYQKIVLHQHHSFILIQQKKYLIILSHLSLISV